MFTPSTMRARASPPKTTSFAAMFYYSEWGSVELLLDDREQVVFLHDQQFVAADLDGLAAVLAEQDAVADLAVQGDEVALVVALARAHGQDFTLIGLFGGGVGNDDARGSLGFAVNTLDDHAIGQRTKFHCISWIRNWVVVFWAPIPQDRLPVDWRRGLLALNHSEC
eukprot:TRINITY_DN10533_c2_g1_i1.p1 TRINITY_DN10533_c2_g1~~TRINITY_DN10533_c2_g1_i1.p1  ORF type:complete len:167 (+),score=19.70 TRINITY_DN10533_c2_g1_i1:94-594(+)